MCEICRQTPCPEMCPNADPPKVIGYCDQCDCAITADNIYFTDNSDNTFCSDDCAMEFYGIRETEYNGDD